MIFRLRDRLDPAPELVGAHDPARTEQLADRIHLAGEIGERMRAVPKGKDPRGWIPLGAGGAMALAGLGLVVLMRRWTQRSGRNAAVGASKAVLAPRDNYDDRLDDELAHMEDAS